MSEVVENPLVALNNARADGYRAAQAFAAATRPAPDRKGTKPTVLQVDNGYIRIVPTPTSGVLGHARALLCAEIEQLLNTMDDQGSVALTRIVRGIQSGI